MKSLLFCLIVVAKFATFATLSLPKTVLSTTKLINRCVEVISTEGIFEVSPRKAGPESEVAIGKTCGIYLVAGHSSNIRVDIADLSYGRKEDMVVFFDGWEMNGRTFPSSSNHHLSLGQRSLVLNNSRQTAEFDSSQNAAMIQYKIGKATDFVIIVTHTPNPEPCNILMSSGEERVTIRSPAGVTRNCTLANLMFPAAKYRIDDFSFGVQRNSYNSLLRKMVCQSAIDRLIIGGSNSLESVDHIESIEVRCNDQQKIKKDFVVLCESSGVTLVSSGMLENSMTISTEEAKAEDFDPDSNHVLMCPNSIDQDYDYIYDADYYR